MEKPAEQEWWQILFDPDWTKIFSYKERETRKEVGAIRKLLGIPPGSQILDLGCGSGRISIALAKLGYQVTGLDYSRPLLEKAAQRAKRAGLVINWVQGDMRHIGLVNRFDAAASIFTSFGYFSNENDNIKSLHSINRALKKSGKLILDVENIFFISRVAQVYGNEALYRPIEQHQGWVEEVTDFDPADQRVSMSLRLWLPKNKAVKNAQASYRVYTLVELKDLLKEAGFTFHSVYGDFKLTDYTLDSERMVVLAIKQ